MIYVFEVSLIAKLTGAPLRTMVECITADNPNSARKKLEEQVPNGWEINKAVLIGSRKK